MNLEQLRAQARTVASRMEARITTAIEANRELTDAEAADNGADEKELADLKVKIATAEAGGCVEGQPDPVDPAKAATNAERARILALADLCPSSVLATPLRKAIEGGVDAGAFAIDLAKGAKARGAFIADLKAGAVQDDQLPTGRATAEGTPGKAPTGAARGAAIVARAAALGHSAVSHLRPKG